MHLQYYTVVVYDNFPSQNVFLLWLLLSYYTKTMCSSANAVTFLLLDLFTFCLELHLNLKLKMSFLLSNEYLHSTILLLV